MPPVGTGVGYAVGAGDGVGYMVGALLYMPRTTIAGSGVPGKTRGPGETRPAALLADNSPGLPGVGAIVPDMESGESVDGCPFAALLKASAKAVTEEKRCSGCLAMARAKIPFI